MTPTSNNLLTDELRKKYNLIDQATGDLTHRATDVINVAKRIMRLREEKDELSRDADLTRFVSPATLHSGNLKPVMKEMFEILQKAGFTPTVAVAKEDPAPDADNRKVEEKPKMSGMRSFWVGEEPETKKYALGPLEKAMKEWRAGTLMSVRAKTHIPSTHDILLWTAMSDYFGYKEDDAQYVNRLDGVVADIFGVPAHRVRRDRPESREGQTATEESIKQQSDTSSIKDILQKMVPDGRASVTWNEGFDSCTKEFIPATNAPDYKKLVHAVQRWFDQQSAAKRRGTLPMSWDIELAKVVTEVFNLSVESENPAENGEPAARRPEEIPEDEILDDPRPDDLRPQASDIVYSAFAENVGFMLALPKSDRTYMTFEIRRHDDGAISFETSIEPAS